MPEPYDVLIVGAGLSGIGMACHLQMQCPGKRVAILERRKAIGGTWDLFRYPGIRSDSDMFTFGYAFRPWNELKVLADGTSIRNYVRDTAREYQVEDKIQFGLKVTRADWSSARQCWTVTATDEESGTERVFQSRFLVSCSGYYNYDQGYLPEFPGREQFKGQFIHPQHWPEKLDYKGKRVVVIGSGATAVTLVPAMADDTAHTTMLQRSPTYIFSIPNLDRVSQVLLKVLPARWVYAFARRRNIFLSRGIFKLSRRWPKAMRRFFLDGVRRQLGPQADMSHFTPRYQPWDERLCAVPDADLFAVLKSGKASVVTDHIETFNQTGIRLKSGRQLDADIIIAATGLQVQLFGGVQVSLNGQTRAANELLTYKSVMLQDVPNLGFIIGYTNATWTLKADIAAAYLCRLINHMKACGHAVAVPRAPQGMLDGGGIFGTLMSGYVKRSASVLPRQGRELPWRMLHNYELDKPMLLKAPVEDGVMEFSGSNEKLAGQAQQALAA